LNLHAIVAGAVGIVNPFVTLSVQQSTGYVTNADFSRTPTYNSVTIQGQVQGLNFHDFRILEGLNIQGQSRKVYASGQYNSIVRETHKGGDIVTDPLGNQWKITQVLEYWPDWCCFVMMLQMPVNSGTLLQPSPFAIGQGQTGVSHT
jgi:hypothetical protein